MPHRRRSPGGRRRARRRHSRRPSRRRGCCRGRGRAPSRPRPQSSGWLRLRRALFAGAAFFARAGGFRRSLLCPSARHEGLFARSGPAPARTQGSVEHPLDEQLEEPRSVDVDPRVPVRGRVLQHEPAVDHRAAVAVLRPGLDLDVASTVVTSVGSITCATARASWIGDPSNAYRDSWKRWKKSDSSATARRRTRAAKGLSACARRPGYDEATGIGTPNMTTLITARR